MYLWFGEVCVIFLVFIVIYDGLILNKKFKKNKNNFLRKGCS